MLLSGLTSTAQDFSNKGKQFWLAYSYHVGMTSGTPPVMTLYLTSDVATTYTVEVFGVTTISSGPINAGQVIPVIIPSTYFINDEGLFNGRAIRVTAVKPIVVYSYITRSAASGATLCLPTNVLGKEYISANFTQLSNENQSNGFFTIVAVEDNTTVEITPSANTKNGWAAGSVNIVNLNKGQIYQVLGSTPNLSGVDLTGSKIKSIASGSGGCKKIAVFSGSGKIRIPASGCATNSSDNLYQQLYPIASWGKKYLTVPSYTRPNNYYRIIRSNPASNVYLNGTLIPAASFINDYYQFFNNTPNLIESDIPISVFQYFTTQNCDGNSGAYDPDMIALSPVEQNIDKVTLVSSNMVATPPQHHMHVIMRNGGTGISSFLLDGLSVSPLLWNVHPSDANYSYLYLGNVSQGYHTLRSDSGFNALAYGYAPAETYGYSAGANVKDLYQQIGVATQFGIETTPSVCKNSPFKFKISLPYCVDSIRWDLGSLPSTPAPPIPPTLTTYTSCVAGPGGPDSIRFVNGTPIYWYSLPVSYTVNTSGTYPITLSTYSSTTNVCGTQQDVDFDLNVFDPPVADFNFSTSGCVAESVQFEDITTTPRPSYIWNWNFDDPGSGASNTSTLRNPTHIFSAPGTYNVRFSTITTPGCVSAEIIKPVIIKPLPSATIAGTATVCVNDPEPQITFTGTDGTPEYTFSYTIDAGAGPGPILTVNSTGGNASINVPTATAGTFRYNLVEVKNIGSTLCVKAYTNTFVDVVVNANTGLALISGSSNQSLCQDVAISDITYTISGGGNNATASGLPPGVTGVYNAGVFTISGTPTTPGTYNYSVTATGLCLPNTLTGTITVNPDADIALSSGNNTQAVCESTPIANILYNITGGGTGATVSGLPAGVTGSFSGGVFTIQGSPTVIGTFNYTVTTTGTCLQKTATGTITVNPDAVLLLTSGVPSTNQSLCENVAIANITYNISGGGTGGTVSGLPPGVNGVYAGGIFTISGTPTTPGTYNYTVTTTGTCLQKIANGTITVNPDAAIVLTSAPATNAQELCINSPIATITYSISGGGTGGTVSGLPAGVSGVYNAGVFTITGTPSASGTFNYTVTTTGTCIQKTATGTIILNALPTPNFSVTTPSCETKVLTFTDLSTPNSGALNGWSWTFGDAGTSLLQNPTHTYAAAGTYTVTLSVTNDKGCVSNPILSRNVTVNAQPVTDAILPEVCLSDTYAQFYDNSSVAAPGSITSWLWNFGDPGSGPLNTSTLEDPQHSYSATGNYTVTLTTTTNNGCSSTATFPFTINGDIPVANFNALNATTMCANDSISIQDASTVNFGSITKVEIYWDNVGAPATFDTDNTPTPGKIYKHKYPNFQAPLTRTFNIRYRAYSGGTCVNDRIRTITVNAAPKVQFNNMPPACLDAAPFQITQATETGGVPGSGVFTGPGVTSGGIFNPASVGPGTYLIKYTYTSSAGGCVDTLSKPITVIDSASARFTYSPINCEKQAVTFNSTTSTIPAGAGTITGWNWNFGDPASGAANTSTLQNPSHTFTGWGNYTVTLSVSTSNACRSTANSSSIFVNPIPRPNFTVPASVCLPAATIAFNSSPSSIPDGTQASFTYLWNFGDPASGALNTATGSSPSHIYNTAGPFNVNLQITSGAGCVHDTTIVVNNIHPQPLGSFTVDKTEICVGAGSFTFTDNSNPMDGTTTQWNWNMDDGNTRTTRVVNYTFANARTYNVTLYTVNSHGCRSTSFTLPITVHPYPVVDAGPDRIMLEGGQIVMEPTVTGSGLTYLWTPTPTRVFAGSNTIRNPAINGIDDILLTLTVTGVGGCKDDDQVFIKVLKFPSIPNIFSPNGDGVHDRWVIDYLNTYPGSTVDIYNRYGQLIFHSDGYAVPWDGTVGGKPVPVGTYYYIVNPKNGRKIMSGYVDVIR